MKKIVLALLLAVIMMPTTVKSQVARDNHLFLHVDFAAGNIYTAAFPSLLTWGLNELTESNIFESALELPFYSSDGFELKHSRNDCSRLV